MDTYTVEFTTTVSIEAENENDALDKATKELESRGVNTNLFYTYVNGDSCN